MRKIDIIRFASGNFLRRKARSALTVLGVIIGTTAVVIMLSIGIGMNKGFEDQINSYGNIREISVYQKYGYVDEETGEYVQNAAPAPLDDIAVEQIKAIDHVQACSPYQSSYRYIIKDNTQKASASIVGIDAASMEDFDYEILYGRLLNEEDVGTTNFVMCFNIPFYFYDMRGGEEIYYHEPVDGEQLPFNPVGDYKYEFTWYYDYGTGAVDTSKPRIKLVEGNCVGILVQKAGGDYSQEIYMDVKGLMDMEEILDDNQQKYYNSGSDYGTVYASSNVNVIGGSNVNVIGGSNVNVIGGIGTSSGDGTDSDRESIYSQITVLADDTNHVQSIEKELRAMGYDTSSSMDYLTQMQEQTKFLRSILGAIGVVAFFVAALSITNTMVMSIYERTREIGIMKVLGCKLSDIRGMFLIEAGIIGVIGGILGIGLSYIASAVVNTLAAKGGMSMVGIDASTSALSVIPPWLDLAALVLATAVGVISGLYPAIRATRLSALDAIKNE